MHKIGFISKSSQNYRIIKKIRYGENRGCVKRCDTLVNFVKIKIKNKDINALL